MAYSDGPGVVVSDRAADQLAEVFGLSPAGAADAVAALLAATEPGEPVVITAEGRLMRLESYRYHIDSTPFTGLRLTPLEPSPKETTS